MPASNLPKKILHFVGREDYLNLIESVYLKEKNKKIVVLSSFAGTGKTTLANEFGYQYRDKQPAKCSIVYWIKSDNNNADNEFKELALDLQIKLNEKQMNDPKYIAKQIKNKIYLIDYNILFIFDNCDAFNQIDEYITMLSDLKNTKILITTRDSTLIENLPADTSEHIILEPFELDQSIEYLSRNLKDKVNNKTKLKQLLDLFDLSSEKIRPHVLNLLIAFVKLKVNPFRSFESMIDEINNNREKTHNNSIIDTAMFDSLVENVSLGILSSMVHFLTPILFKLKCMNIFSK